MGRSNWTRTDEIIVNHNKGCHIPRENLPKVNGVDVDGIWCPDSFATDVRVLDETDWSYSTPNPFTKEIDDINFIGTLPQEFKDLLGWQEVVKGEKRFIRNISFRTDSSGHASIDSFMTIYGNDKQYSVWHTDNCTKDDKCLTEKNPYVKKWLALCKKNVLIKYIPNPDQSFEQHFPNDQLKNQWNGTMFKTIDGLNYPTMYSEHWIPFGHMPYISNNNGIEDIYGCPVKDNIRVFDDKLNVHLYLEKVIEPKKNDENLVKLSFSNDMGLYYVQISRWRDDNEYVRYAIETKNRDRGFTVVAYKNGEKKHKSETWGNNLYRINRIVNSIENS